MPDASTENRMIYFVTYDLHKLGRDYSKVDELLEAADEWTHPMGSVWFIDSQNSAAYWRDALKAVVDSNDEVMVARLRKDWAALRMDSSSVEWLKADTRNW